MSSKSDNQEEILVSSHEQNAEDISAETAEKVEQEKKSDEQNNVHDYESKKIKSDDEKNNDDASVQVKCIKRSIRIHELWLFIFILFCLIGTGYVYEEYRNIPSIVAKSESSISILKSESVKRSDLEAFVNKQKDTIEKLKAENLSLKKDISTIESSVEQTHSGYQITQEKINDLYQRLGNRQADDVWYLYEIEFLVNMADRKMHIDQDYKTSIKLLGDADKLLVKLDDVRARNLRAAIEKDCSVLAAIKKVDLEGVMLRLGSITQEINMLPLKGLNTGNSGYIGQENSNEVTNNVSDWQSNLVNSVKNFLGNFITVKKRTHNETELLSPNNEQNLRENLINTMLTAQSAFYRGDNKLYHFYLKQADNCIKKYFIQNDENVSRILADINNLEDITIEEVKAPEYLQSSIVIKEYIKTVETQDIKAE